MLKTNKTSFSAKSYPKPHSKSTKLICYCFFSITQVFYPASLEAEIIRTMMYLNKSAVKGHVCLYHRWTFCCIIYTWEKHRGGISWRDLYVLFDRVPISFFFISCLYVYMGRKIQYSISRCVAWRAKLSCQTGLGQHLWLDDFKKHSLDSILRGPVIMNYTFMFP